ncbi:MAG: LPS export ABC transporter periplasmic protein LptC [Halopseudomonas sp.]
MNRKRVKLFLSLTASALLILAWGFMQPERAVLLPQPEHIGEADTYVTGVRIQQFDTSGRLSHSIQGQRIRHLPNTDHTLIDEPIMTLYREGKPPISAEARLGDLEPNHDVFWLRDEVVIYNQIDRRYRLESPYLKVIPEQKRIETDAEVTLYQPIGNTHAVGMTANFADDQLILHNAVRGRYEPN